MNTMANTTGWKRADLHCHSEASNRAAEVALRAISCPECYSDPLMVHAQAKRRGMDFVTITDHDTLEGVLRIDHLPDVLVGVELTCWFPEDQCKLHLLVYGIDRETHATLQSMANDLYQVAEYLEKHNIAHSVAHPIYRQNDKLEKWHLERLLLIFKGFECLNGAHSSLHREAFEPIVDRLTPAEIERLSRKHDLKPRWEEPWVKTRTAGSDDHGLLNIGRTFTEFPPETRTVAEALECLRTARTRPGGEPGSSAKLAHTFYSVAVRYYTQQVLTPGRTPNMAGLMMQLLVGQRPKPGKLEMARIYARHKAKKIWKRVKSPFAPEQKTGTGGVLARLFTESVKNRIGQHPNLGRALKRGLPPLGEHDEVFAFASDINRDITQGIAEAFQQNIKDASFTGVFDSISAVMAHQFTLMPYYFAVFHQNKERHLLRRITGQRQGKTDQPLKVGLFTDTLDDINGVARFIRDMATQAGSQGRQLSVATCGPSEKIVGPWRTNFKPLLSMPMPYYPDLVASLPPVLEVLEWADRQQFDAVHVSTPGPMGMCGWLVAKMLRVPMLATYHTDFPAYMRNLTGGDHRVEMATRKYMEWFYREAATTFSRSQSYRANLSQLGVPEEKLAGMTPAINTQTFNATKRDTGVWDRLGINQKNKLLYAGRISKEKNLLLLADAFIALCKAGHDAALIFAGEGPLTEDLKKRLAGHPAYFLGRQNDAQLAPLYASADLFAFPSRTDTLGQVVIEAQCSGLPAIVSNEGGPKEIVEDHVTGRILGGTDVGIWTQAIAELLSDPAARDRMSRAAAGRIGQFDLRRTFEDFWSRHARLAQGELSEDELLPPVRPSIRQG